MMDMQRREAAGLAGQQQEQEMQQNSSPGMVANNNYMVMQNAGENMGQQFPQGPLGALRQMKDSKKNEWQLAAEVNELKRQRNTDIDHIKILKVELQKLEQMFKKYKECLSPDSVPQVQLETLPNLITMAQCPQMIDTEVLLLEIHRVKGQL